MNDALRGVAVLVSVAAWFYAARIAVYFIGRALQSTTHRHHIVHHVAYMFVAVTLNAALAVVEATERAGTNATFTWREALRALAQLAIILALTALLRAGVLRKGRATTPTSGVRDV